LVFLTSCAVAPFQPPKQFDDPVIDWDAITKFHTIPNVEKMDQWAKKIHDAKALEPQLKVIDGKEYICYTVENHRELLKQLHHGRFAWSLAEDFRKQLEINQAVMQQVVILAKIIEQKSQLYRGMWIDSESRYLQLEHQVKIDNIIHKVQMGAFLLAILVVLGFAL
jgi:hypothetical protein